MTNNRVSAPKRRRQVALSAAARIALTTLTLAIAACGGGTSDTSSPVPANAVVKGTVYGGQQPLVGSTVTLYAAGTTSNGTASTSFTPVATTTLADGGFDIPFTCQSGDTNLYYVTSTGGNANGGSNSAIGLMAVLGGCNSSSFPTSVNVDEVTTAAAVFSLAQYLDTATATQLGATSAALISSGIAAANVRSNLAQGTATSMIANVNTLAAIISSCVNSTSSGFTECANLFTAAGSPSPSNNGTTLLAALDIALNPTANITNIFGLAPKAPPFLPVLAAAPATFSLWPTLTTTVAAGTTAAESTINQGTAIGEGSLNGATPFTLNDLLSSNLSPPGNTASTYFTLPSSDSNNSTTTGVVSDTAYGFCNYNSTTPTRVSYVTGPKGPGNSTPGPAGSGNTATVSSVLTTADASVAMAPFYFPLVFNSTNTTTDNVTFANTNNGGGKPPILGLFDWRPNSIDEALVVAESDDYGKTWYFDQTVLELFPDYTAKISSGSGGFGSNGTTKVGNSALTSTGCPATASGTNTGVFAQSASGGTLSASGNGADDGWGHPAILQLPIAGNSTTSKTQTSGQFLYLLDRGSGMDVNQLLAINIIPSSKFPIFNSNVNTVGANDIKAIASALVNTTGSTAGTPAVQQTAPATGNIGLQNPDGIMAVFPLSATATTNATSSTPIYVMYLQKVLNGDDNAGPYALPSGEQCAVASANGNNINHDVTNVRLASTTDGIHFSDLGIVQGLNDPTTVDYNGTRWISPRGTLIDVKGDGSLWGLYFSGGNCLDGDSEGFHYIGYAEATMSTPYNPTTLSSWTVYNDINSPIASINSTGAILQQTDGSTVTIPANPPVFATQPWFAQRVYTPTAVQVSPTQLSLTFAGSGVQAPTTTNGLLNYRQVGNILLNVSPALTLATTPNNINAH